MTKKEMIDILVSEYGVEDKSLMRKTAKELEKMIAEKREEVEKTEEVVQEVEGVEEVKEVEEVKGTIEPEKPRKASKEVVSELQLNIHETIIRRFEPARDLRIENLGAGDVFIGESKENLISEGNKLAPGQGKAMNDISVLYITSASRPIIRIIY